MSYITLVVFVPAIIGFALIHHYCTGCDCQENETRFIFLAQDSNSNNLCQSCDISATESCCSGNNHHNNEKGCSNEHEHKSDVNLKKLDEPTTFPSGSNPLPNPVVIENMFMISATLVAENSADLFYISEYANEPPDSVNASGTQRLCMNCVFRL
ncbi:hypothetical protein [Alkalitalea saponilacus]|uniref:hypothetical protein n=1 Tax=Alkalitalea saponilacus TaxID=889453 RepID=UPI0011784308|nr:hypothetical protein [Alkalitalea saponilacus]